MGWGRELENRRESPIFSFLFQYYSLFWGSGNNSNNVSSWEQSLLRLMNSPRCVLLCMKRHSAQHTHSATQPAAPRAAHSSLLRTSGSCLNVLLSSWGTKAFWHRLSSSIWKKAIFLKQRNGDRGEQNKAFDSTLGKNVQLEPGFILIPSLDSCFTGLTQNNVGFVSESLKTPPGCLFQTAGVRPRGD